ncbi:MAG: integration host factor subunit alpha [Candidatus Electrothrix sp. AUS3]|nr:integration host factor subunit alpha [Candidatus Electrothrix gigas]
MGTFTKQEFAEKITTRIGYPNKMAEEIVEMFLEEIKSTLEKGEDVKVSNFGRWDVKEKQARNGRNPSTGDTITITPRKVVAFHPATRFRDYVNQNYSSNS